MEENQQNTEFGLELANWQVPEYDKHYRPRSWYMASSVIVVAMLIYAYFTGNFLFAVIIVVGSIVVIFNDGQEPAMVKVRLTSEGIIVGRKFHDYDGIKNFAVVYKPSQDVKKLYFEFKNALKPRLSISLINMDPLPIRENLLKYLPEDLERTDQPLSESLARLFRL
jgi:hypothetical protein